ncbi:dihydrofolate reductase family protein [Streptomyces iakyrus]|uniref:dihydrofolate reductase family protein n=1 Tax=Streptomyces iakyrus TaxID=68219 RepID=UPI001FD775CA|nr:dihydrofolate reductase family protein [Streptomyces iakyrus]
MPGKAPLFLLTHHPEDAPPIPGVTSLDCDVAEELRIARETAGDKNVEVFSPTIGRQLLERGLIDVIDLHIAPVLLGGGIRLAVRQPPAARPSGWSCSAGRTAGRSPHAPSNPGHTPSSPGN